MEEQNDYTIDVKETLLRNILWIPMFILVCTFCILGMNVVVSIEDKVIHLMAFIFSLFFTLKLLSWNGHPTIVLKEKEKIISLGKLKKLEQITNRK